jgi:hypothetical protein
VNFNPARGKRKRYSSSADPQLQNPAALCKLGKPVDCGVLDGSEPLIVNVGEVITIGRCDIFVHRFLVAL